MRKPPRRRPSLAWALAALVAAALAGCVSGCAEYQAMATGFDTAATKAVQNVNDDALHVEIQGICAQPYSALVRNAGTVKGLPQAILALCGPIPAPGVNAVLGSVVQVPESGGPVVSLKPAGAP